MRTKTELFDSMLKLTANLGYAFEKPFFQGEAWKNAKTVVDIGCGNAEYISLLAKEYPDKNFIGVEKHPLLAKISYDRHNKNNLKIINSDYKNLPEDFSFDFLLARRSIVHINPREEFYAWMLTHANSNAGILIIETDMVKFNFDNSLPLFNKLYISLNNLNPETSSGILKNSIETELVALQFNHILTQSLIINTSLPGIKNNFYIYMRLIAEQAFGSPVPTDLAEELFNWLINANSYAENYIFGALFTITC